MRGRAAVECNVFIKETMPDGTVRHYEAHNDMTTAGLTLIAKLLTGEDTSIQYSQPWDIRLNGDTVRGTASFEEARININADYTPTSQVDWSGQSLNLDLGDTTRSDVSAQVNMATVADDDFTPPLTTTSANSTLSITWILWFSWVGAVTPTVTTGLLYHQVFPQDGDPNQGISPRAVVRTFINLGRGIEGAPFNNLEGLQVIEKQMTSAAVAVQAETRISDVAIGRSGLVITVSWTRPTIAPTLTGIQRMRLITPVWIASGDPAIGSRNIENFRPLCSYLVDWPQGARGTTTQFSFSITLSDG